MRILFTGMGSIGRRHARVLQEIDDSVELLAYRSGSSNRTAPAEVEEYTDLDQALGTDPDVAFITNPTHRHINTAMECARANCHLFVEKPLSHTMEGVDELINEVDRRGLISTVGCQLRFDPVLKRVDKLLESKELGKVHSFHAYSGSYLPEWRPDQDYRNSYSAKAGQGGGVVLDLIHEIDYTYWLFGRPTRVQSELSWVDELEIDSEAVAEILIRTADGTVGNIHLSYCRRQPRRQLEVVCESGTVIGDLLSGELVKGYPSTTAVESFEYERDDKFRAQAKYFLDHVRQGVPCKNDLQEGKRVLEVALEAKEDGFDE